MGRSADDFFVALDQDSAQGKTLPNWCVHVPCIYDVPDRSLFDRRNGELYLEVSRYPSFNFLFFIKKNMISLFSQFHRGTYTSHGSIKKGNRLSEILLRDLEVCLSYGVTSPI
jgi:alpha-mannosidase